MRPLRIRILEHGHRPFQKVALVGLGLVVGHVLPPLLTMSYRREHFGKWMARCFEEALWEATEWRRSETELFGAFVSKLNRCDFGIVQHEAIAADVHGDRKLIEAILADYRTAPIDDRLRGTLAFIEKLVLAPAEVTAADAEQARRAGASSRALREAAYVAFSFGVMDRLADAFDFEPSSGRALTWNARLVSLLGYRAASIPG